MPYSQVELSIPAVFHEGFVPHRRATMRTDKQRVQTSVPRNGDKRLGVERRRFSYDAHIPERRSGLDRRNSGVRPTIAEERYNGIPLALG
jgi:hypothetical protein